MFVDKFRLQELTQLTVARTGQIGHQQGTEGSIVKRPLRVSISRGSGNIVGAGAIWPCATKLALDSKQTMHRSIHRRLFMTMPFSEFSCWGTLLDVGVQRGSSRQYVSIWPDSWAPRLVSLSQELVILAHFWGHKAVNWRVRRFLSALLKKAMSFVFINFLASFRQFSYNYLIFNYFLASFPHSLFCCVCLQ